MSAGRGVGIASATGAAIVAVAAIGVAIMTAGGKPRRPSGAGVTVGPITSTWIAALGWMAVPSKRKEAS